MNKRYFKILLVAYVLLAGCGKQSYRQFPVEAFAIGTQTGLYGNVWRMSVELSTVNFPDASFRELLSDLADTDSDGILTLQERESLTELCDTFYNNVGEGIEPECKKERVMAELLSEVANFTGIEYFPKLKTISIRQKKGSKLQGLNLRGMLQLSELDLYIAEREGVCTFHLEDLPQLQTIRIETANPRALCDIELKNVENLKEFRVDGNIAELNGLAQTGVQTIILNLDEKAGGNALAGPIESDALTYDLSEFLSLRELQLHTTREAERFEFIGGAALEMLGVETPGGTVILRDMPKLWEVRMFGGQAIQSEKCDALVSLKIAKSGSLDCLDLGQLSALKLLEIVWTTMDVKKLILPNDLVDIADRSGTARTVISYKEQPFLDTMIKTLGTTFAESENRTELPNATVEYEEIDTEVLSGNGIFEFVCTPGHGYRVDLDGDGTSEELYADAQDFYINGIGQGIARGDYMETAIPWHTFWLVALDASDERLSLILNTVPKERYCSADQNRDEFNPVYYWTSNFDMEWGNYGIQRFTPNDYVGQCLMQYDGVLRLQAYAEGYFIKSSLAQKDTLCYPFMQMVYDIEGNMAFQCEAGESIRVYGSEGNSAIFIRD